MKIIKNNVIDINERLNRYKDLDMVRLMELMIEFLELNPYPIVNKNTLRDGMKLFNQVAFKANTIEMKGLAISYVQLYKQQLEKVE